MNYLKGKNCASYVIKEVEKYVVGNPNCFEEKRFIEALIGLILAKSLSTYFNENINVGWIFNNSDKNFSIPKVEVVIGSKIEIIDDDFDFFLESENLFCLIQATRYCFTDKSRDKVEQLKDLFRGRQTPSSAPLWFPFFKGMTLILQVETPVVSTSSIFPIKFGTTFAEVLCRVQACLNLYRKGIVLSM